jgi:hypothetical protein
MRSWCSFSGVRQSPCDRNVAVAAVLAVPPNNIGTGTGTVPSHAVASAYCQYAIRLSSIKRDESFKIIINFVDGVFPCEANK